MSSLSAMTKMTRAIRLVCEEYSGPKKYRPTLSDLPQDVLIAFAEIINAFATDLNEEILRRG